jgi:hypothetical protein
MYNGFDRAPEKSLTTLRMLRLNLECNKKYCSKLSS